jgi:hypothetical protein
MQVELQLVSLLWTHTPDISSAPAQLLEHFYHEESDDLSAFESAVIKLENDKYLYIRFQTDDRTDLRQGIGITEFEEFDTLEEAVILYKESIGHEFYDELAEKARSQAT